MRFLLLALALVLFAGSAHAERIVVRNSPGAVVTPPQVDAGRLQKRGTYRVQLIPAGRRIVRQRIW